MPHPKDDPDKAAYQRWHHEVSQLCILHLGIGLSDLPDMLTRDAFDNGTTPEEFFDNDVAELVMEEFGETGALLIQEYRTKRHERPRILQPEA